MSSVARLELSEEKVGFKLSVMDVTRGNMAGDRNVKVAFFTRAIRWVEDCFKTHIRVKDSEKRSLRRKRRHDSKREYSLSSVA